MRPFTEYDLRDVTVTDALKKGPYTPLILTVKENIRF